MPPKEMLSDEIEQFIINARVGRLGLSLTDGLHIVPVDYAYSNGERAWVWDRISILGLGSGWNFYQPAKGLK